MESRRRKSDRKRSEIIRLYLQGWTRDDIAKKTGVSAGGVSNMIREFTDCADSSSLAEADVVETVEGLRSLAVEIRKAGTSVEGLMGLSKMLGRIRKLTDLDRLEELIKVGESLGDRAHLEASVRMHAIEERTGRSHDEILSDLESKEARIRELSSEIQRLNSEIRSLNSEREKVQADFNAEKAQLEAELGEHLKQHGLALEKIEHISRIEREFIRYGVELTHLEELQRVLSTVEEADHDAKKIVEQFLKKGSLQAQIEADAKELAEIRKSAAELNETVSALEERLKEAEIVVEKYRELESMGWSREALERTVKLAREVASPEEFLGRLELLKPLVELRGELERGKAEVASIASERRKLQKAYDSLRRRWDGLEEVTGAVKELFAKGFSREALLSIHNEASKYGSAPLFMEAFNRYKHLKELEAQIEMLEGEREALKGEVEKKRGEVEELDTRREAVALRAGQLGAELERRMRAVSGLQFFTALADDPRSLTTDSAAWFAERIRIWAENKQATVKKKAYISSDVGDKSRWLCESIMKLKESGH